MDHSTPGLPVHHHLPESTQTRVHRVSDAIQPSHPLSSPPPFALNLSQHQGLFQWVSSSHQVARLLEFQLQHQSFQWTPRTDLLYDGLVGSSCSPRDSQESSPTPQFKSISSSVLSFLYSQTLTSIHNYWKIHSLTDGPMSRMLAWLWPKSFKQGFSSMWTRNSQCTSWTYKRQRKQRLNCQHLLDHGKAKEFHKNIYFWFIDYPKAFGCVDHNKLWKLLKLMAIWDNLTCLLRNWEGNRQEGQGSPNWGNLQVSDIFISVKQQEETN